MNGTYLVMVEEMPARKGIFVAYLGAREVCRSRQPLRAVAHILLAEGFDPGARMVMRFAGTNLDVFAGTIRSAARPMAKEAHDSAPSGAQQEEKTS